MSVCLGYVGEDYMLLAADSRGARITQGIALAVRDDCKKIYSYDNNQIIFTSGYQPIVERIMEIYTTKKKHTPKVLDTIINDVFKVSKRRNSVGTDVEITFFRYNGDCRVEITNWTNDDKADDLYSGCDIVSKYTHVLDDDGIITVGVDTDKKDHYINELGRITSSGTDGIVSTTLNFMSSITSEYVGGTMTAYLLKPNHTCGKVELPITDSRKILRESDLIFDPKNGLKITGPPSTSSGRGSEITLNAANEEMFRLEEINNAGEVTNWFMKFIKSTRKLMVNGFIYCKDLYLGDGNSTLSALTINDKGNDAIKGDMLDCKGVLVRDDNDTVTLEIDGNGNLTTSGDIVASRMFASYPSATAQQHAQPGDVIGSRLYASEPTQQQFNADPKGTIRSANIVGGSITSDTNINVTQNAIIGNNIQLGDQNSSGKSIIFSDSASISNPLGTDAIKLSTASGGRNVYVTAGATDFENRVVIQSDLTTLEQRIAALENAI